MSAGQVRTGPMVTGSYTGGWGPGPGGGWENGQTGCDARARAGATHSHDGHNMHIDIGNSGLARTIYTNNLHKDLFIRHCLHTAKFKNML